MEGCSILTSEYSLNAAADPRQPAPDAVPSVLHDQVQAKREGLRSVWINRRHDRPG